VSRAVLDRASAGALSTTCRASRDRLNEHLDGALGEREGERLEAHLAGCPACRAFANTLQATIRAVRELPREQLPAAARARLQQLVRASDVRQREQAEVGPLRPGGAKG
jgi:anti-sigma factor RsiW